MPEIMDSFSVLISVYAKEVPEYFSEAIESIFNQTLPPTEVVLVEDGGLTEELYQIIESQKQKHPNLKTVRLAVNRGLAHALNEGLKHCSYDLVARMDSDDISMPHRFEKQVSFMMEHLDIDICSSSIDEFDGTPDNVIARRTMPEHHEEIYKYGKRRCPVNHPAVMYRRSKVLAVGGYQNYPEDVFLWFKMMISGSRFYNFQESLLWFRWSPELYKRRGGWKYAKKEFWSQVNAYQIGYINLCELTLNVIVRMTTRLLPNSLRQWIYLHLLRRSGQND